MINIIEFEEEPFRRHIKTTDLYNKIIKKHQQEEENECLKNI